MKRRGIHGKPMAALTTASATIQPFSNSQSSQSFVMPCMVQVQFHKGNRAGVPHGVPRCTPKWFPNSIALPPAMLRQTILTAALSPLDVSWCCRRSLWGRIQMDLASPRALLHLRGFRTSRAHSQPCAVKRCPGGMQQVPHQGLIWQGPARRTNTLSISKKIDTRIIPGPC